MSSTRSSFAWRAFCSVSAALSAHLAYAWGRADVRAAISIGLPLLLLPWLPSAIKFFADAVRDDLPPTRDLAMKLVKARRSTRVEDFLRERKVDDEVIASMLEAARWAPIHTRKQPWRFRVYCGEASKKGLQGFLKGMQLEGTKGFGEAMEANDVTSASHVIVISYVPLTDLERETAPSWEEIAATAASVQNMELLACANEGVGCFWCTLGSLGKNDGDARRAHEFFQFQKGEVCLGMLLVGAVETKRYKSAREPVESNVTWIR